MAQRNTYNTSHMYEAESEQQWNLLHSEEHHHHHFARTPENGPIFHPGDNVSAEQVHYASQWNASTSSNGYPSSTPMVNPPHFLPSTSNPPRDFLHPPAAPSTCMIPENPVHHASSSNYGAESNFFDQSMGNVRGPYKRKSPGIPLMSQRGSTSRYHHAGSSSDVSSMSEIRQEKSSLDSQHNHWEPLISPIYRTRHHSNRGESSVRNVRNRPAKNLESDAFSTHLPANYSDYPCSSRLPVDHPVSLHHSNVNSSLSLPEWTPTQASGAPPGRLLSNGHESNSHMFAGSSIGQASGELGAYHQEHFPGRNSVVPPSMHTIPSHTRGVRSSFTHRSSPNTRVTMSNVPLGGHMVPPSESLQHIGETHSSRHLRPFGPSGWRHGDRNVRPRLSSERYGLFPENTSTSDRLTPEGLMIDRSLYGSRHMLDHHRDMRLDIDNMSYEELLALGERIGSVSTGVPQDELRKCLTETVYCSSDQNQEEERCVICLDEYEHMDDVGTLKACGHDYHVSCIKKWLSLKNLCPICKAPAVPENTNGK